MDIGREVRRHRLAAGLTLEQLAARVNAQEGGWRGRRARDGKPPRLDSGLLSRIEGRYADARGLDQLEPGREVTVAQWIQLAAALEVPPTALLVTGDRTRDLPGFGQVEQHEVAAVVTGLDQAPPVDGLRSFRRWSQYLAWSAWADELGRSIAQGGTVTDERRDAVAGLAWLRELLADDGVSVDHLTPPALLELLDAQPTRDEYGRVQHPTAVTVVEAAGRVAVDADTGDPLGSLPPHQVRRRETRYADGTVEVAEHDGNTWTRTSYGPDGAVAQHDSGPLPAPQEDGR